MGPAEAITLVRGALADGEWWTVRRLMEATGLTQNQARYPLASLIVTGEIEWKPGTATKYRRSPSWPNSAPPT